MSMKFILPIFSFIVPALHVFFYLKNLVQTKVNNIFLLDVL